MTGLGEYYLRGDVSASSRSALLRLHCRTNGRFTACLTPLMKLSRPARKTRPVSGILGSLSCRQQEEIAAEIARNGFHKFEARLPESQIEEIERFARQTPAQVECGDSLMLFDEHRPVSKTYRVLEPDIVRSPAMQKLMADRSVLAVAETYLGTRPILSRLNLWFSPAHGNAPGDNAAQEFHFDFDPPPVWLLFFVYLTDVGPDNGPHIFVRGTHIPGRPESADLLRRGYVRIPDEDIAERFGASNIVELHGKRGTILAVDTRGFHKGKMPVIGHRLMAQLTFSCPPFSGAHGRRIRLPSQIDPALLTAIKDSPDVFGDRYILS